MKCLYFGKCIKFKNFTNKNILLKSFSNNNEIQYKLFSENYIEVFNSFLEKQLLDYKNEENILKMEKELFKFLFKDKKLKMINIEDLNNSDKNNITFLTRKKFIMNSSRFIELCYNEKIYSSNFSEFNKILVYYMISFYDISNRRVYLYFNINLALYFLQNPNYENTFKRFIVSKVYDNFDIIKFSHFINFVNFACKENNLNLFYPFNPLKLDRNILTNFFTGKNKFTYKDLISTLNMTDEFPFSERIYLIENVLERMENISESIVTGDLINIIKGFKLLECEYHIKINKENSIFENNKKIKKIFENIKISLLNKLKFSMMNKLPEHLMHNIPKFYKFIDEFVKNGRFIEDKEVFDNIYNIIYRVSEKNEIVKNSLNEIYERFLEFNPLFNIKILIPHFANNIPNINMNEMITIFKCVIYSEIIETESESKLKILKEYCKNVVNNKNNYTNFNLDSVIEYTFYLSHIYLFKIIDINDKFNENFDYLLKMIILNLKSNQELDENILNRIDNCENNHKFDIYKINHNSINYLYLITLFVENKFNHTERCDDMLNLKNYILNYYEQKYKLNSFHKKIIKKNKINKECIIIPINKNNIYHFIIKNKKENNEDRFSIVIVNNSEGIKTNLTESLMEKYLIKTNNFEKINRI